MNLHNLTANIIEGFDEGQKNDCLASIKLELHGIAMSMAAITYTLNHLDLNEDEMETVSNELISVFNKYGVKLVESGEEVKDGH